MRQAHQFVEMAILAQGQEIAGRLFALAVPGPALAIRIVSIVNYCFYDYFFGFTYDIRQLLVALQVARDRTSRNITGPDFAIRRSSVCTSLTTLNEKFQKDYLGFLEQSKNSLNKITCVLKVSKTFFCDVFLSVMFSDYFSKSKNEKYLFISRFFQQISDKSRMTSGHVT